MSDQPTLLLFPGLGVDARVFEPQQCLPLRLEVAEWIEPESWSETLAHYAQRMTAAIGPQPNLYVGGISLGAMAALEGARLLNARGVFLIGGCSSHRQISPLFRTLLATVARMPVRAIQPSLLLAHSWTGRRGHPAEECAGRLRGAGRPTFDQPGARK